MQKSDAEHARATRLSRAVLEHLRSWEVGLKEQSGYRDDNKRTIVI